MSKFTFLINGKEIPLATKDVASEEAFMEAASAAIRSSIDFQITELQSAPPRTQEGAFLSAELREEIQIRAGRESEHIKKVVQHMFENLKTYQDMCTDEELWDYKPKDNSTNKAMVKAALEVSMALKWKRIKVWKADKKLLKFYPQFRPVGKMLDIIFKKIYKTSDATSRQAMIESYDLSKI